MIAACPKCQAKYRIDVKRLGAGGGRLRCAKCQTVFRVRAPAEAASARAKAPVEAPAPAPPAPAPPAAGSATPDRAAARSPGPATETEPAVDRERLVIVADADIEAGKAVIGALSSWGLQPVLVHDGVEAVLTIQRMLPRVVILDASLPKMYGFQICELMKRNESLRSIHVVLVGSVHHPDRYRRPPNELYGADAYEEKPQLLARLPAILISFGLRPAVAEPIAKPAPVKPPAPQPSAPRAPEPSAPPAPAPRPVTEPIAPPVAAPQSAAQPPSGDGLDEERSNAERLARIIVSDIVLYHPEPFDAGLPSGQVLQALEGAIQEGRGFFAQRVDARVRDEKDYLMEELLRVVRQRGGQ